jgi:hypothetical protein
MKRYAIQATHNEFDNMTIKERATPALIYWNMGNDAYYVYKNRYGRTGGFIGNEFVRELINHLERKDKT